MHRVLTINAVPLRQRFDGNVYQVLSIFVQSIFFLAAVNFLLRCVFRSERTHFFLPRINDCVLVARGLDVVGSFHDSLPEGHYTPNITAGKRANRSFVLHAPGLGASIPTGMRPRRSIPALAR